MDVTPRVVLFSDIRGREGYAKVFFPLSTLAVGTALKRRGFEVKIIDAQVDDDWPLTMAELLPGSLFLGISALTGPSLGPALDAVEVCRRVSPEIPVVWGGYHATHNFRGLFAEGLADIVVLGFGEEAACQIADALREEGDAARQQRLSSVPGLVYRDGHELRINPQRKLSSMGQVPAIDYSLVDAEAYLASNGRILHVITSYGCPHGCTFCVEPTQSLRRWRGMEARRVVDGFARHVEMYRPSLISIHDPNFSSDPRRVVEIAEDILARDLKLSILCDMRARDIVQISRMIDLRNLRAAGFERVFLGLESGSDRILALLNKGSTREDAYSACQLLDEAGILALTSFMHDIPGESEIDSDMTFDLLERIGRFATSRQRHHFFTPYPGTPLFERLAAADKAMKTWSQRRWAETGTYWGSEIWPGREGFRRQVVQRLKALQTRFPHALEPSGLPQLERPSQHTLAMAAPAGEYRISRGRMGDADRLHGG